MLRSLSLVARRHPRRPFNSPPSLLFTVRYVSSSPSPPTPLSPDSHKSFSKHGLSKHKLDLRPAPLKPSKPPPTPLRNLKSKLDLTAQTKASRPTTPQGSNSPIPKDERGIKEAAQRDIAEAEATGILIPPPPDANWFRRILHKGIQLAKFYYRGVKLIYIRRGEIAQINARLRQEGGAPLTRQEFRLIRTQRDDINKVIPFLVIALLLEELIPIIAIYAPRFLPSTCILPSQRARIDASRAAKAAATAQSSRALLAVVRTHCLGDLGLASLRVDGAPAAVCRILGLSTIGFDALRIRRIRQHMKFLAEDDKLLLQDGLHLSESAIDEALAERALSVPGSPLKTKLARLEWWLNSVQEMTANASVDPDAYRLYLLLSKL